MEYRNGPYTEQIYITLFDPKTTANIDKLQRHDKYAVDAIKHLENMILKVKEHRNELAARAVDLSLMDSRTTITLKREKRYKDKVYYFLTEKRIYADGTSHLISSTKYEGKRRSDAIKAFNQIKTKKPHYDFVLDIEKSWWE